MTKSILILDDNHVSALCLKQFVDEYFKGAKVTVLHNLRSLIKFIDTNRKAFDLAFLDYNLPDGTGADAGKLLDCKKILVSGWDLTKEQYDECHAAGIMVFIAKPVDMQKVRKVADQPCVNWESFVAPILVVIAFAVFCIGSAAEALASYAR